MKYALLTIIILSSTAYGQMPNDNIKSINIIAADEGKAYERLVSVKNGSGASDNFDVKYYRCQWQTDPAVRFLKGKVTSYFVYTSAADFISFDITDSLVVDSVTQKNAPVSFTQSNNTVRINLPSTAVKGTLDSISIYYEGVPPNTGFGSYVTTTHSGAPGMWTLSEPYGSRDWWPCKNGLDDKADSIDVFITAPLQYTAASNGLMKDTVINGSFKTTHWKHRYPIATYLVCMAVTNYAVLNDSVKIGNTELPMQTFSYPESIAAWQANTPLVLSTIQFYSSIFGAYPFIKEKYGHVQFGWGGGQEHQTSTFIVTPQDLLMAHELGHQWFGDKITCGSWQDIWLNEGFATHLSVMNYERKYPQLADTNRRNENNIITSLPNGSVWVDDTTNIKRIFSSRLTYYKGSHLLFMLRWKLGDSVFFKAINKYLNDSAISFGFARTADLKRNLEAVSGIDLTDFFNDWFYGQGYPSYHVKWSQIGNDYVKIVMNQTTSDTSVKFFSLPVALQFKNATQQKIVVVNNIYNNQIFFNDIGFIADTVIIDPNYWLISNHNTSQKITDSIPGKNEVHIFPNPFSSSFALLLQNFDVQSVSIKLSDAQGRLLYNKNMDINQSLYTVINVPQLAKGMYFISVQAAGSVLITKKILKQ